MNILAIGEVMMRLTPPSHKMIEQATTLDLSFSGTGLNILSGLSRNQVNTSILTGLPDNAVGLAAASFIRKLGVSDEWIHFSGNHIGTYFLEQGYGSRPSQVTYLNRDASSFCQEEIPHSLIESAIDAHDIIHVCGIALSTSTVSRKLILDAVDLAYTKNKKIMFDFNYRPSLNEGVDYKQLLEDYCFILERSYLVFGSSRDIGNLYGSTDESEEKLIETFFKDFSQVNWFSGTKRGSKDTLKGVIHTRDSMVESTARELSIFDRIGTGDAFAAGLILGNLREWSLQESVDFATSCAELAHTTFGDSPVLNEAFVKQYMEQPEVQVFR